MINQLKVVWIARQHQIGFLHACLAFHPPLPRSWARHPLFDFRLPGVRHCR
jgi:hypothetical protein